MDSDRFDGLVRSFGLARSRRQALRGLAGVAAGASALALRGDTRAQDASLGASPEAEASPMSSMGTEIAWVPVWTVTPGASLESVRAVLEEMVTSAQGEAGTLSYAVYVSEDGQTIIFYERYADEAAVLVHQTHFGERFAERAQEAGMTCTRITVLGSLGEEVRKTISGCHPIYLQPFGGFSVR